jgi:hypothetical protein
MKNTPDIHQYALLMKEIKNRTEVIFFFLTGAGHALFRPTTLESMCLQIRKILELIALSSLIANKSKYCEVYDNFTKAWNAEYLLRDLERINTNFYPQPVREEETQEITKTGEPVKSKWENVDTSEYLTKDDFIKVYKKCGAMMHADNPKGTKVDYSYYEKAIPEWIRKIMRLLNSHQIHLVDDENIYLIHMKEDRDDEVHYYTFSPIKGA